jgi:hypothetical protein
MNNVISPDKLKKYFSVTGKALEMCKEHITKKKDAADFLDMAQRYYSDATFFFKKHDHVNAFAALNYAHGWLDAGARIGLFDVHDSTLFTVDDA